VDARDNAADDSETKTIDIALAPRQITPSATLRARLSRRKKALSEKSEFSHTPQKTLYYSRFLELLVLSGSMKPN
jgi:hypothetical protein